MKLPIVSASINLTKECNLRCSYCFTGGKAKETMKDLRRAYDLLMMKVLSLLQDEDQQLASAIVASREAIWGLLADPVKFETLQT